jgi:hypothetical protein
MCGGRDGLLVFLTMSSVSVVILLPADLIPIQWFLFAQIMDIY